MTEPTRPTPDAVNKIFGNPLPDTPIEERDPQSPDDDSERDRWLRDNVPPHHG
ncbi:hypothetical protein [Mycolicibacterium chubuense]|jgi:hypothetical protein|uniref:Uncharacterized protein n=1 Tax=Mycolicibacterium chubuense TaxID=1800 RepID=A0A0J6VWW3_MYCCU|nr:hypothetical protein [Mycolicibacterium chubuense]KMO73973.1 hypothetical protein MCHUDSM44219_04028 [Mycolicibacterium chubuense]SPX97773.1 Uncharacterised protein [Mycolicibacterium chubuense]